MRCPASVFLLFINLFCTRCRRKLARRCLIMHFYPYPRHNLSQYRLRDISRYNMRYYAVLRDIWRFCPILRASAPFATPHKFIVRAQNCARASQDSSDMSRSRSRSHSLRAAVFVGGVNKRTFARHVALGWRVRGIVRYCAILCDIMR